jgi:hypothetical protein
MKFVDAVRELSFSWEKYWLTKKPNKDHPVHQLVHRTIPDIVADWISAPSEFKVKGSDGQGALLRTPWINAMKRSVTESAQQGYYIVFLFDSTMSSLVLELGFGAQQFEDAHGRGKSFFSAIERAVSSMQLNTSHLVATLDESFRSRLSKNPSNLHHRGDFKLRAYEKCSIYHISYDIGDVLEEERVKSDFLEMLKLYELMAESVLLPDVEDYVIEEAALESDHVKLAKVFEDDLSIPLFVPPIRKRKTKGKNGKSASQSFRRSTKAEKIGKLGEEFVFRREKARLEKLGRSDLAEMVIWHREFPEDRQPGWDITSYNEDGQKILIEVKSTVAGKISSVEVTTNEWNKMCENRGKGNYVIFLVTRVADTPTLLGAVWDPAVKIDEGTFVIQPEIYSIDLRAED